MVLKNIIFEEADKLAVRAHIRCATPSPDSSVSDAASDANSSDDECGHVRVFPTQYHQDHHEHQEHYKHSADDASSVASFHSCMSSECNDDQYETNHTHHLAIIKHKLQTIEAIALMTLCRAESGLRQLHERAPLPLSERIVSATASIAVLEGDPGVDVDA